MSFFRCITVVSTFVAVIGIWLASHYFGWLPINWRGDNGAVEVHLEYLQSWDSRTGHFESLRQKKFIHPVKESEYQEIVGKLQFIWPRKGERAGYILHFLHLRDVVPDELRPKDGLTFDEMLLIFLDSTACEKNYGREQSMFELTRYGLRYTMPNRPSVTAQGHDDQVISMLAEQRLPLDTELHVESKLARNKFTINNLMTDLLARFSTRHEFEWSLLCIAQYDPKLNSWSNRFGEKYTFEEAVHELIKKDLARSSCCGMHACTTVAALMQLNEKYDIFSQETRELMDTYLKSVLLAVDETMTGAGIVNPLWHTSSSFAEWAPSNQKSLKSSAPSSLIDQMLVTSHFIEFCSTLPDSVKYDSQKLTPMYQFLNSSIRRLHPNQGRQYICPFSHSLKVVLSAMDIEGKEN